MTYQDDDWVVVAVNETTSGLAFQRAPGNRPSTWPDPEVPLPYSPSAVGTAHFCDP